MLDLGKVPVHLTVTAGDAQLLMNALAQYVPDEPDPLVYERADILTHYLRVNSESSVQKHRAAGVPVAGNVRVLPTGTVVRLRGDAA